MPATFVGATSSGNSTSSTSRSTTVPTGAQAGDVALCVLDRWFGSNTNPAITFSGFTQIGFASSGDNAAKITAFYKRLTGADTGSYTASWTGSAFAILTCHLFRGVIDTGDPTADVMKSVSGTFGTFTSMSLTADAGAALLWRVYNDAGGTHTPPTGSGTWTEAIDVDCAAGAYQIAVSSGTQTASGGAASTSSPAVGLLIGLKPQGASGVPAQGQAPAGLLSTGQAVKVAHVSATCSLAAATGGGAVKVARAGGVSAGGLAAAATERAVRTQTGQADLGTGATSAASKRAPAAGVTPLGAAAAHSGLIVRAVSGVCHLGGSGWGSARKQATASAAATAGLYAAGAASKRAVPIAVAEVGLDPHARAGKSATAGAALSLGFVLAHAAQVSDQQDITLTATLAPQGRITSTLGARRWTATLEAQP